MEDNSGNQRLIHGHIHNYDSVTYIHGHVHKRTIQDTSPVHSTSPNCSSFQDCHHFELINYKQLQSQQENHSELISIPRKKDCYEENCKPKVMEICCDQDHSDEFLDKMIFFDDKNNVINSNQFPEFINCNLTCNTTNTSHLFSGNTLFEDFCQENINCDASESGKNSLEDPCHDHVLNREGDWNIFQDLMNISSLNMQKHSLPDVYDHHHHRIEFHPHSSGIYYNDISNEKNSHTQLHHHNHFLSESDSQSLKSTLNTINFNWNTNTINDIDDEKLSCQWDQCSQSSKTLIDLQSHMIKDHIFDYQSTTPLSCKWRDCFFEPEDENSLINHINDSHGTGFDLRFLDKKSIEIQTLDHHLLHSPNHISHTKDILCKWDHCTFRFDNPKMLNDHIEQIHLPSGRSKYQCEWYHCKKTFNQRQKLLRHIRVHTSYKPFTCKECNKSFSTEDILAQHLRIHSGEKPFKCHLCPKMFATSSSLKIHIRTHTGEKPLQCKICDKRFNESSNLSKHMKIHVRKFKCLKCHKSFHRLEQLNLHKTKCIT